MDHCNYPGRIWVGIIQGRNLKLGKHLEWRNRDETRWEK